MAADEATTVVSPMAGTIHELLVVPGTVVEIGDELLIIESMKMEIPIEATTAGKLDRVLVAVGDKVSEGDALVVIA
jgi:acetyl-CoA carboxylase biotin carboxyl carrier protein